MDSHKIDVKIDIVDTLNQVVYFINQQEIIPREMEIFDVKARIILSYLEKISKRAVELDDKILLDSLYNLGCISELIYPGGFNEQ